VPLAVMSSHRYACRLGKLVEVVTCSQNGYVIYVECTICILYQSLCYVYYLYTLPVDSNVFCMMQSTTVVTSVGSSVILLFKWLLPLKFYFDYLLGLAQTSNSRDLLLIKQYVFITVF